MAIQFKKKEAGRMGVLTIPQGTRLYKRTGGSERARQEFDVLAMPTNSGREAVKGNDAYSFKLRDVFWFVLNEDL